MPFGLSVETKFALVFLHRNVVMFAYLVGAPSYVYLFLAMVSARPCTGDLVTTSRALLQFFMHLHLSRSWQMTSTRWNPLCLSCANSFDRLVRILCSSSSRVLPSLNFLLLFLPLLFPLVLRNHAFPFFPHCFVVEPLSLTSGYEFVRTQPSVCLDPPPKCHCG